MFNTTTVASHAQYTIHNTQYTIYNILNSNPNPNPNQASEKTKFNSYEMLTVQLYGSNMGIAVEVSIIIFCFGTCIAYIIAVGDILEQAILDVFRSSLPSYITRESLMVLFWVAVMFPLSLFEKINSLRFASMFGVASIFFLSFATTFHSFRDLANDGWDHSWGLSDVRLGPKVSTCIMAVAVALACPNIIQLTLSPQDPLDLIKAMPVIMFAFTCQVNVFSIYEELNNKSVKKMQRVR